MRRFLILMGLFLITFTLLAEFTYRVVIPESEFPVSKYLEHYQIAVYDQEQAETGIFSVGKYRKKRIPWHINSSGWSSPIEYLNASERNKPLIALIGNSYIQGFNVESEKHIATHLRKQIGDQYDIYSFGRSQATLADYLAIARYIQEEFDPDIFVFFVIHSDLDRSIRNLQVRQTITQIQYENGTCREIPLPNRWFEDKPIENTSLWSQMSHLINQVLQMRYKSSLYRHLMALGGLEWIEGNFVAVVQQEEDDRKEESKTVEVGPDETEKDMLRSIVSDYIVSTMRGEFPDKHILFAIDAPRPYIYHQKDRDKLVPSAVSPILEKSCVKYQCDFFDLTVPLYDDYQKHHRFFDYVFNRHWNGYGNKVIANTLIDHLNMR